MLKTVLTVLVAIAIAIAGGTASVWYVLKAREGVGAITVGGWSAFPSIGAPDADPYSRARVAREGILALGRAEGLAFTAERDSGGQALRSECDYRIEGRMPAARLWTLYANGAGDRPVPSGNARAGALHSLEIVRTAPEAIDIGLGRNPAPGNWLPLTGSGPVSFVMTFYDTPIASSTGVDNIQLPVIHRVRCDD